MPLFQGVTPEKTPNYLLGLPVQRMESLTSDWQPKIQSLSGKAFPQKKTCPICTNTYQMSPELYIQELEPGIHPELGVQEPMCAFGGRA